MQQWRRSARSWIFSIYIDELPYVIGCLTCPKGLHFLWFWVKNTSLPLGIGTFFSILQLIHSLPNFIDFNCPASKQVTKETIRIGAGETVMYNTNPDGADK